MFLMSGGESSRGKVVDRWAEATVRLMDEAEEVAEVQSGEIMEGFVCSLIS